MKWSMRFLTLALIAMLPINVLGTIEGLQSGHNILAALNATSVLMILWTLRRPVDWAITGFCMWWMHRKALKAMEYLNSLKDEDNGDV